MHRSLAPPRPRRRWRGRIGATALSAGAHVGLAVALLAGWRTAAPAALQTAVEVSVAPALQPPAPPAPKAPTPKPAAARSKASAPTSAQAAPTKAPARTAAAAPIAARASRAPPAPQSPPAARAPADAVGDGDDAIGAQLAASERAGPGTGVGGQGEGQGFGSGGGGGGDCDMAGRVQAALRKDPLARAAVHAAAGGGAIVIWNGDWVQASAEDGKGLAAVREAITWEVAFAPPACRHQRVRGPILLSLNDGSARLAVGAGDWRWSDLLGLR